MHAFPTLPFSKMHGAGNDVVVLDLREVPEPSSALCRYLSDRRMGVGCDMILGIAAPRSAQAVASYRIWTPDGSPSMQCGNGARCVAAWVVRAGLATGDRFLLDSPSGTHAVDVLGGRRFRVAMGIPAFAPDRIPLAGFESEQDLYEVDLDGGRRIRFAAVSTGNPHAVLEVDYETGAPVAEIGPALQKSRVLPPTVNVGFVRVVNRKRLILRVYEYGAGETLACGTGACAAAAVMMRRGRVDRSVSVVLPGGELDIVWPDEQAPIMMSGPAAFVFEGRLDTSPLAGQPD